LSDQPLRYIKALDSLYKYLFMLNPKLASIFVVILFLGGALHAQQPAILEVVDEFFKRYDNVDYPHILRFQKRKDGWYTSEIDYTRPNEHLNVQQFWNKSTNQYELLNYPARADKSLKVVSESAEQYKNYYLDTFEIANFARYIYYGYLGWDWDLINELKDEKKLSDGLLESLARAYSAYASGFFFDQYGNHFVNGDTDRIILKDTAFISPPRKDKFIQYEWKALEAFQRLRQQNPSYVTTVGTIATKLANEHLYAWSMVRFAGYAKDAEAFLPLVNYPDSILDKAKRILDAIRQGGIFVSSGDNDTYPVWYLQFAKQYRADVSVINYSLMGLRRYIVYVDKLYEHRLFNTMASEYMQPDFDYALYSEGSCSTAIALNKLPSLIKYKEGRRVFECNELVKTISPSLSAVVFKGKVMLPSMKIRLGKYLFLNDYLILDMIGKHFYDQPIYFAWPEQVSGLEPYLQPRGPVYWLAPVKN
jgi:hypothetical protein